MDECSLGGAGTDRAKGLPVCEKTAWMNGVALGDGHQAGEGSRIRMRKRSVRVLL